MALIFCLGLACTPILHQIARILIIDEETDDPRYLWLFEPAENYSQVDSQYDRAAEMFRQDPTRKILLIEAERMSRLVREGMVPSYETISRRQLEVRGVERGAIEALETARDAWKGTRRLQQWLRERPDGHVLAFCSRFRGRYYRFLLDSVLAPEEAQRVRLAAVPDQRFDETNWWRSRVGFKEFFTGTVALLYAWCHGENTLEPPPWDPDRYEADLLSNGGSGP